MALGHTLVTEGDSQAFATVRTVSMLVRVPERGRVLVVDDSYDTRVELRELLEEEGYAVMTACTGREALAFLRAGNRPTLALVDLWMPIMDGSELARWVREDPALASLPLILITAQDPAPSVRALADGYLRKPFGRDDVLEVVERYAGERAP